MTDKQKQKVREKFRERFQEEFDDLESAWGYCPKKDEPTLFQDDIESYLIQKLEEQERESYRKGYRDGEKNKYPQFVSFGDQQIDISQVVDKAVKEKERELVERIEKLKIPLMPKNFGYGGVEINGKDFMLDSGSKECVMLDEIAKEQNLKIEALINSITKE